MMLRILFFLFFISSALFPQISLEEKIGQMILVGFSGSTFSEQINSLDTLKNDLQKKQIGGVVLFTWAGNLNNPVQIKSLTDSLQFLSKTPLLICIDQEGGRVARLNQNNGFRKTNSAYRLGTILNNEDSTRTQASATAGWFIQTGINMNLAPVVDININPNSPAIGALERSYSADTLIVVNHASYTLNEFHKKKIITTLKHFPGHGSALNDSHLGFTDITKTWKPFELYPYKKLISDNSADVIMTGHLFNSTIDSVYPATLSYNFITGLLRNQLNFSGVVMTDDLLMKAITDLYSFEETITKAINAGVDILTFKTNIYPSRDSFSIAKKAVTIITNEVSTGKIPINRINESYNRIMNLKNKYLITPVIEKEKESKEFELSQNYPNPFNSLTRIEFFIWKKDLINITIFDVLGRKVKTLINRELEPGRYSENLEMSGFPSGIYFYELRNSGFRATKKLILLK